MTRVVSSVAQVIAALWLGLQATVGFVVAPYLFSLAAGGSPSVPHSGVAADLIGPLLHATDATSLTASAVIFVLLLVLRARRVLPLGARFRVPEIGLAAAAAAAAVNFAVITPKVLSVREDLTARYGAFHLADKTDPAYATFGALHGVSSSLFLVAFLGTLTCVVCMTHFRTVQPAG